MNTTAIRHRRFSLLLATAAVSAVLLTGCNEDPATDAGAQGVDTVPTSAPAAPSQEPSTQAPVEPAEPVEPVEPVEPAVETEVPSSATTLDALAAFPLIDGWDDSFASPSGYLEFPVETLENSFADYACGGPAPVADTLGTRKAQTYDAEYYASRELLAFADADAAVAYLAELKDFYASCPPQGSDGISYPLQVRDTTTGGASFGVVRTAVADDGSPQSSLFVLQAVRVGHAILLDVGIGDGAVEGEPKLQEVLQFAAEGSAPLVAQMCVFTEAGC